LDFDKIPKKKIIYFDSPILKSERIKNKDSYDKPYSSLNILEKVYIFGKALFNKEDM
jgi:hypothetical protein